jgi:hypothetical protein
VYETTNGAALWAPVTGDLGDIVSAIAIAPSDPTVVYAATKAGNIFVNTAAAPPVMWTKISAPPLPGRWVTRLAVDRTNPDVLYATFSGFDAATPARPGHVFRRAPDSAGVLQWTRADGGDGVAILPPKPLPDIPVNAIELDWNDPDVLYVGTDVGIFRTADRGLTWDVFDAGLPSCIVTDLTIDPAANMLYAATFGRGVYRLQL